MIEINKISKSFNSHKIIEDISATFDKGKTNLIIGQSGSGKTVLMKCLLGLHEVDEPWIQGVANGQRGHHSPCSPEGDVPE